MMLPVKPVSHTSKDHSTDQQSSSAQTAAIAAVIQMFQKCVQHTWSSLEDGHIQDAGEMAGLRLMHQKHILFQCHLRRRVTVSIGCSPPQLQVTLKDVHSPNGLLTTSVRSFSHCTCMHKPLWHPLTSLWSLDQKAKYYKTAEFQKKGVRNGSTSQTCLLLVPAVLSKLEKKKKKGAIGL